MSNFELINKLNMLLLDYAFTDKAQRFGQYLESNWDGLVLSSYHYESHDSYEVYSKVIDMIENGEL